jgi:hypothetical protein
VPRLRCVDQREAPATEVSILEAGRDQLDRTALGDSGPSGHRRHLGARLDRGHLHPARRHQAGRLAGAGADLKRRRTRHTLSSPGGEIVDERVRIARAHRLVELGDLAEDQSPRPLAHARQSDMAPQARRYPA